MLYVIYAVNLVRLSDFLHGHIYHVYIALPSHTCYHDTSYHQNIVGTDRIPDPAELGSKVVSADFR